MRYNNEKGKKLGLSTIRGTPGLIILCIGSTELIERIGAYEDVKSGDAPAAESPPK